MYEKVEICPCCNSKEFVNHLICDDYSVSQESFAIMKCSNCGFLVTSPRPDQNSIGTYYQSDDYVSHNNKSNNLTNFLFKIARSFTLKQKYRLVNKLSTKKRLLDYGSGSGVLLNHFKENGWQVHGIEPDDKTREQSIDTYKLDVKKNLQDLSSNKYDIISLWHVLEHVHDLNTTIKQFHSILSNKGHLIIAVPNHQSYDQKFYKEYWAAYDVPRHLYHFSQTTIKELMKYHSFEFIESHPQKLDAYYVSLLSEKYKKNPLRYIKSILIGWLSNRWANKNHNNYSSLIYIFKKA
ncbi:MAG: class I SAM-dependent methyltransferase [Reichenbachiella sp.]